MKRLGNSDVKVSDQILGCWVMGGSYWGGAEDRDSLEAILRAYEGGINPDTAYIYGRGVQSGLWDSKVNAEEITVITSFGKQK